VGKKLIEEKNRRGDLHRKKVRVTKDGERRPRKKVCRGAQRQGKWGQGIPEGPQGEIESSGEGRKILNKTGGNQVGKKVGKKTN